MVLGILRLLVSARSWVLGTALPVERGEIRAGLAGGTSPPLEPASGSKLGGAVDSLSKCVVAVWEAAKGAHTASQQSEIEEKRRVVFEQPTAHSAREQLEQEVPALSKLESAYQRQHKAAVDSCVLLAETGDKVKEQKNAGAASVCGGGAGDVQGSWRAGCVGDEVTFLFVIGSSNPQRAAAMLLAARHSQPGPGILPGHTQPNALVLPGAAGPRNATCASIATYGTALRSSSLHPSYHSRFPRVDAGASSSGAVLLMILAAFTLPLNQLGLLQ